MDYLVSVLMPVYNGMPLIKASIQSLLQQTYTNWECIIVDDGSNDGTSEYLDSLKDSRFIIHHFSENKGRPFARQKTLELAKGDFIAMLDAEDLYAPQKIEKQVCAFKEHSEVCLVSTGMCSFGVGTDLLRVRGVKKSKLTFYDGYYTPSHATCMLVGERAKKLKYNPYMKFGQDVDFLSRYLVGGKYYELADIMYYYSEFDSVTKKKIRRTYRLMMVNNRRNGKYRTSFVYFMKYVYSYLVFPFVSIEKILKKRGRELSPNEINDYNNDCKAIIEMCV